MGRRISSRVLEKYTNAVLAVYICGSTAKKLDRPYSDLEMVCVVRDGTEILNKYYVCDGLLVEIDYHQESEYLKAAREPVWDWPLKADQYRNRLVLFEKDNWMRKLDEAVAENDRADFTETIRIQALAMTESLAALRNANFKQDHLDLRTRAFYLAWDTVRVVFLLNRKICAHYQLVLEATIRVQRAAEESQKTHRGCRRICRILYKSVDRRRRDAMARNDADSSATWDYHGVCGDYRVMP